MKIEVKRLSEKEFKSRKVQSWPVWNKEISHFQWHYSTCEECYIMEGDVSVITPDGTEIRFSRGDFITFPEGLECEWIIHKPVKKHYNLF